MAHREGIVQAANFNSPGQVVLSGEIAAVKKAVELIIENARALQKSQSQVTADFAILLDALEGRACADLTHEFYDMVLDQRLAFFEHRDLVLGRLMRDKLRWESLPAAP